MKCRTCYWLAVAFCITAMALGAGGYANGRYGGAKPGTIDDRPRTVRRDEAAIRFSQHTADRWLEEDKAACEGARNWGHNSDDFTLCMVHRSNTRLLYMLRQNCVGLNASACKEKLQ